MLFVACKKLVNNGNAKAKEKGHVHTFTPGWNSHACERNISKRFPAVLFSPVVASTLVGPLEKKVRNGSNIQLFVTPFRFARFRPRMMRESLERRVRSLNLLLRVRERGQVEPAIEGVEVPFLPTCKHTLYTMDAPSSSTNEVRLLHHSARRAFDRCGLASRDIDGFSLRHL